MPTAILVLVRHDPNEPRQNLYSDERLAERCAKQGPCWVIVLGLEQEARRKAMNKVLGSTDSTLTVNAPTELTTKDNAWNPDALATYLLDTGLRIPRQRYETLEVRLQETFPPPLLAAVVEAAACTTGVDVYLGETPLKSSLRWELRRSRFQSPRPQHLTAELDGQSPATERVRDQVRRFATRDFPILIVGETGTEKEQVARMLHERSARRGLMTTPVLAGLAPEAADSLLFGHTEGFDRANRSRKGRIVEAEDGTVFIDDLFDLELSTQGKLTRALSRANTGVILVEPHGSVAPAVPVHARFVAATTPMGPRAAGAASVVREELYYRVAAGVIELPPLRDRREDIPALCKALLRELANGPQPPEVSPDGYDVLQDHAWTGNVRELRLVLLRAIVDAAPADPVLDARALRQAIRAISLPRGGIALPLPCDLEAELARIEVQTMTQALQATNDNRAAAGRLIGLSGDGHNFGATLARAEKRLRKREASHEQ